MAATALRVKGKRNDGGLAPPPPPPPRAPFRRTYPVAPLGRKWLKIDAEGNSQIMATDRHRLTHELGVQTRDLRILDPKFSTNYPSAILCRENALVVNLLHIKAILTTEYVLIMDPETQDGELDPFVKELENRLSHNDLMASASFPVLSNYLGQKKTGRTKENTTGRETASGETRPGAIRLDHRAENGNDEGGNGSNAGLRSSPPVMPFELKALEVCLESVCKILDSNATQLEGTAFPAIDDLTLNVNTKNLHRVRTVKSKIAQLKTHVETVKEVLEKFLDDDEDMRDMNLTAKQMHRSQTHNFDAIIKSGDTFTEFEHDSTFRPPPSPGSSVSTNSSVFDEEVQEVEMLLEAYFMQIDHIFNRLLTLNEYIDDTEDFINIVQDKHRNQLLQLELLIAAGTFALTMVAVVSGIFGMNLNNTFSETSPTPFLLVTCLSLAVALIVLGIILWFCRLKGLMNI